MYDTAPKWKTLVAFPPIFDIVLWILRTCVSFIVIFILSESQNSCQIFIIILDSSKIFIIILNSSRFYVAAMCFWNARYPTKPIM